MLNERLTVVMLNWKRPQNVIRFVAKYLAMPAVAKVIVADCNPSDATDSLFKSKELLCIRTNQDPGMLARFAAASLARTDAVLLADDDIEPDERHVNRLFERWLQEGEYKPVVGIFGRQFNKDGRYVSSITTHGRVPVVLTRLLVAGTELCARAITSTRQMADATGGEPYGNGEDIVLSYTAMKLSRGKLNLAVSMPYKNAGYADADAISVRYAGHESHRTNVVSWCRKNLFDDRI